MIEMRNMLRRQGCKVKGKAIGTTLLTKGSELDTVVVLLIVTHDLAQSITSSDRVS